MSEQRSLLVRAVWFLLVGWWVTGIWLSVAWFLNVTTVGLPFGSDDIRCRWSDAQRRDRSSRRVTAAHSTLCSSARVVRVRRLVGEYRLNGARTRSRSQSSACRWRSNLQQAPVRR